MSKDSTKDAPKFYSNTKDNPLNLTAPEGTLSDNERIKAESNFLRGHLPEEIQNPITGGFSEDGIQLIKFHGMYQQDDRDLRPERLEQKLEPRHHLMFRARIPGGIISTEQWQAVDEVAEKTTIYGSIRLTNRQTFQYHGILKNNLKSVFKAMDKVGIDSKFTAGDVNRNTICTSNPIESKLHAEAYEVAKQISEMLLPQTQAYAEVWLDKEKVKGHEEPESEPIYGSDRYLPRKFKTTISIPPHNDVDLFANDLNFVAIGSNESEESSSEKDLTLQGFNVLIGGGLGMTHGDKNTFPRVASPLGYIDKKDVFEIAKAVISVQADFGDRTNRKTSKLKHTIERLGLDKIKAEIERRSGIAFQPEVPYEFTHRGDRFGWVEGIDGDWHYTLFIESGRILDRPDYPLKSGLLAISKVHQGDFRITANQNLIIARVPEAQKNVIDDLLNQFKIKNNHLTPLKQQAMACVSLPTCPLAMAESERFLPGFIAEIQKIMDRNNVGKESLIVRISGCPNGCARAMLAEIGLVGKALNRYNLHIGGNAIGSRIPRLYKENLESEEILKILDILITGWATARHPDEGFGDFVIRTGIVKPVVDSAKDFHQA